jgi:hypothetical protein
MYQDVDVSGYPPFTEFGFFGFVRSLSTDAVIDATQIVLEFRRVDGSLIYSVDSGSQENPGEWQLVKQFFWSGADQIKTVRVRLTSTRNTGPGNDAYYDGLLLRALPAYYGGDPMISNGDNVTASNATLYLPHGLACDTDGSLYIADTYANRIRKVDPSGMITTVVGGCGDDPLFGAQPCVAPATDGSAPALRTTLNFPVSVSINHGGTNANSNWLKLVIADFLNHEVRGLTTTGYLKTISKGSGSACHRYDGNYPDDWRCVFYPMGVDAVGNTLDATGAPDSWGAGITVADRSDNEMLDTLAEPPGTYPPQADFGYTVPITHYGPGLFDNLTPRGWVRGNDWVASNNRPVAVTSIAADPSNVQANPGLVRGHFFQWIRNTNQPDELVPGFFVADLSNHAIRHQTVDGMAQTVAGNGTIGDSGDNGPANLALFNSPSALAESKDGTLYVADAETNRIRKISCGDVDHCTSAAMFNGSSCNWSYFKPPAVNDGNPCTDDACFWTVGAASLLRYGACSDGNPCNGNEQCDGNGHCIPTGSGALAPGTSCADGNACNGDEVCDVNHLCQAGTPVALNSDNPCVAKKCAASGAITLSNVPNNTVCTLNDPCKNPGACSNGTCVASAIELDTSNPCITETCSPTTGIVRASVTGPCPGGVCANGECVQNGGIPAPALNNTVPPTSKDLLAAIYDPVTGVQTGANVGTGATQLNPDHAARLFGVVFDESGAGLANVTVTIVDHPEAGQTLTRSDGKFDIVSNGGGALTVRFVKSGRLVVDRHAAPMWGGGAHIDDVVMLQADPRVTSVAVNSGAIQDAVGSATTATMDARGARRARRVSGGHHGKRGGC